MDAFKAFVKELRKAWPPPYGVRVVPVPKKRLGGNFGECDPTMKGKGRKKWILIRIRKSEYALMVHSLLEEWAHVLTWDTRNDKTSHHLAWSKKYHKLREWLEDQEYVDP